LGITSVHEQWPANHVFIISLLSCVSDIQNNN
jgi:hypothetical protein